MTDKITTGSTVRVLNIAVNRASTRLRPHIHRTFKVTDVRPNGYVMLDGVAPLRGAGWMPDRFELVDHPKADEVKVGKYIISLERDGELLPAPKPRTYGTDGQALRVAEQMAAKHGGKFIVFRAVGEFEMPVQVKPTFRAL